MKWLMLFLTINVNILAAAAVYRVWVPPEVPEVIDPIDQKVLALHKDHLMLQNQHLTLFNQLAQCKGRVI